VTAAAGVAGVGDGRTGTFLDLDYDGYVDIFASNHVNPNRLYRNDGDGTFTDIAGTLGMDQPMDPFGTAFGDYDADGDTDIFLATHFGNSLLRCDGVTNHWIQIHLTGVISNRDAIGAVVRCIVDGQSEYLRVDGGHGMGDSDSEVLAFGLGASPGAVALEIYWPSGIVEFYDGTGAVDTHVDLTEGFTGIPGVGLPPTDGLVILGVSPNPADDFCSLHLQAPQSACQMVRVALYDQAGRMRWSGSIQLSDGATAVPLPVGNLAAGIYLLRVDAGQASAAARIAVLH
jgi:hypothetical protein